MNDEDIKELISKEVRKGSSGYREGRVTAWLDSDVDNSLVHDDSFGPRGGTVFSPYETVLPAGTDEKLANISLRDYYKLDTSQDTIDEDIPVIVSRILIQTLVGKVVGPKIFPTDNTLVNAPGNDIIFPAINTMSFTAVTSTSGGDTLSDSDLDSGTLGEGTITPTYKLGGTKLTYKALDAGLHNWLTLAGKRAGIDAAIKQDLDNLTHCYDTAASGHTTDKSSEGWDSTTGWRKYVKQDIGDAMAYLEADKADPTHIILNTSLSKYIRLHPNFDDYSIFGGQIHTAPKTAFKEAGIQGNMYGMEVVISPQMKGDSAKTDVFMVVDNQNSMFIVNKKPLTVQQKDFPEVLELWLLAHYAQVGGTVQEDGIAGFSDCIAPS